jgi:hypothetical protein
MPMRDLVPIGLVCLVLVQYKAEKEPGRAPSGQLLNWLGIGMIGAEDLDSLWLWLFVIRFFTHSACTSSRMFSTSVSSRCPRTSSVIGVS